MSRFPDARAGLPLRLVGVPLDLGAGRRGVDMGPSALRIADIAERLRGLGRIVEDLGNVEVPQRETLTVGDSSQRYAEAIGVVCGRTYDAVRAACDGGVPVILGGDHSLAAGSVAAVAEAARADGGRVGVVWLDAHGDMNTPRTTGSGNVHGMPLACLLGDGPAEMTGFSPRASALDPEDVALIGIRAIDEAEAATIRATGVHAFTMRDVDERGIRGVLREALDALRARCDRIHVSFDVDFLDPSIAPGVGTRVRGGPNYREAHLVMELLADTGVICSVDVVELNPILDRENKTAELAVELLESLFGKQIL